MVLVQAFFPVRALDQRRHSGSLLPASNLVGGLPRQLAWNHRNIQSTCLVTGRFPPFSSHRIASARPAATNVFAFLIHHPINRYLCWHCVFALPAPRWPAPASNIRAWANPARDSRSATRLVLSLLSHSSLTHPPGQPCFRLLSGGYGPIASLLAVPRSSQTSPRCPSASSMSRELSMSPVRIHFSLPTLHGTPLRMSFSTVLDQFGSVASWAIAHA